MLLPPLFIRPHSATEPPALVRVVAREDVMWDRWIFKAPPLRVQPPLADVASLAVDLRKGEFPGAELPR